MTLKGASLLALIGTALLTLLLLVSLFRIASGVVNGIVPAVSLLASLIRAFAGVCVAVFFWVFYKQRA